MTNDNGKTRYHAEIKLTWDAREVRINIFADTLVEIYRDLANVCEQIPDGLASQAKREVVNADLKAEHLREQLVTTGILPPKASPKPAPKSAQVAVPVCNNCGSSENMELIKWTDKKTGQNRQAWKCQECEQWHFPDGKKP